MHTQSKLSLLEEKQIIIGIDIAKHTHYASIVEKKTGKIIKTGIKIENTRSDFEKFVGLLKRWKTNEIIIGMEPTGHYWKVINNWLAEKGYKTVLVNPYHVKLMKELHNNLNNKNDVKDSQVIAKIVKDGNFLTVVTVEETYDELRGLSLCRNGLVKNLGRVKVQLRTLLDVFLPEYCECFKDPSRKTSLALLKVFSIEGLTNNKHKTRKINIICKVSRGAINRKKAELIVEILSNSIGLKSGINSAKGSLDFIIQQIRFYNEEKASVEQKLAIYLAQTVEAKYMLSMKGIGVVTLGAFLGYTGRLKKFSHPRQLLKFAGLLPVQNKSGKFEGKTKLSKRGNSKLRCVLYRIAVSLISNNTEMRNLYKHKINALKKKKLVALTSIAAKALKILFKMGRNELFYDKSIVEKSLVTT